MDSGGCINHWNETEQKTPKKIRDIFSHGTIGTNVTKGVSMIIQARLCPSLWNKSNDGFWWVCKSLERNRTKNSKKIGDIFSNGTIRTNVTKGV